MSLYGFQELKFQFQVLVAVYAENLYKLTAFSLLTADCKSFYFLMQRAISQA